MGTSFHGPSRLIHPWIIALLQHYNNLYSLIGKEMFWKPQVPENGNSNHKKYELLLCMGCSAYWDTCQHNKRWDTNRCVSCMALNKVNCLDNWCCTQTPNLTKYITFVSLSLSVFITYKYKIKLKIKPSNEPATNLPKWSWDRLICMIFGCILAQIID